MVLEILRRKRDSLVVVNKDIDRLQKQIAKEESVAKAKKSRSDFLKQQKLLDKQLRNERKNLKLDLRALKFQQSKLGRISGKTLDIARSPKTKKTLKKIGKFFSNLDFK